MNIDIKKFKPHPKNCLICMVKKDTVRMEGWLIIEDNLTHKGKILNGQAYGHDRFSDGRIIWTTPIVSVDYETSHVKTQNTEYILGKPKDEAESKS